MGLVTVSPQRISIVAQVCYKPVNLQEIISSVNASEVFIQKEPRIYNLNDSDIMVIPIRDAKHYRVFFISLIAIAN